jgi:hypothetical protein
LRKKRNAKMAEHSSKIKIYLEIGSQKIFAGAIDWPGWSRSGRDEAAAIRALAGYGSRYERAIREARLGFKPPRDASAFSIVERLKGNATTDFGSPGIPPAADARSMKTADLRRSQAILKGCWRAFDRALAAAKGHDLRKGPRGGGRGLNEIIRHLLDADAAYLARLGWSFHQDEKLNLDAEAIRTRGAILEALAAGVGGKLPARGPRGGLHWTPRYFIRRTAWHALDHAWEIEDRT